MLMGGQEAVRRLGLSRTRIPMRVFRMLSDETGGPLCACPDWYEKKNRNELSLWTFAVLFEYGVVTRGSLRGTTV